MATLATNEETIYLASANGRIIHFRVDEVNILSGAARGVIGIKLEEGDDCLGGALMADRFDKFVLETSGGKTMELGRAKYDVTSRGGKGFAALRRSRFIRVLPRPIHLVDWNAIKAEPSDNETGNG